MPSFQEQFVQDKDIPEWYGWHTERPVITDAVARVGLEWDGQCYIDDDVDRESEIEVTAYCEREVGIIPLQENAWKFILNQASAIERELRRKLWTICQGNYREFASNVAADDTEWDEIKGLVDWNSELSLDVQVQLEEIGLFDHGFDEVGFCTFEIQTGWDDEHGVSILMHKDRVLAASSSGDFTGRGAGLVSHARFIQGFAFSEGDLRI